MKTIKEFMTGIVDYFGGCANNTVADMIAEELAYIKPSDYDVLFRQLVTSIPASWKPDYKSLTEAITRSRVVQLEERGTEKTCPVCGTVDYSSGLCPCCKYDGGIRDGTPDQYRDFWNKWNAGQVTKFDVAGLMTRIAAEKKVTP